LRGYKNLIIVKCTKNASCNQLNSRNEVEKVDG
jgi:hypothetical protein